MLVRFEGGTIRRVCHITHITKGGIKYIKGMIPIGPGDESRYTNLGQPFPIRWVASFTCKEDDIDIIENSVLGATAWLDAKPRPSTTISTSDREWRAKGR